MEAQNGSQERPAEVEETNFIGLLNNPQKFRETFFQLAGVASEGIRAQQWEKALKALNKCADMMDLGRNILKDVSKYWKACIYGNLACAYQGAWKMQKCNKFCEKLEQELAKFIETAQNKEHILNLTKLIIMTKFQHCAILSQLNRHDKALQMCKSTFPTLIKYIETILAYALSLQQQQNQLKTTESVQFKRQVSSFAQEILNNLLKSLQEPINNSTKKSEFYYWQKNPENNQQQVKKTFIPSKSADSCKRSILGVNKSSHWIDQFNIGTIMHMSEFTLNTFEKPTPIEQYLFKDKLYEAVIYCSVAHFTIATEIRFIESSKQKEQPEELRPGLLNNNFIQVCISSIIKKYGFEQKSQMFKLSQLYHIKAINIMAQNIKATVPYISHLIKSYDKHYIYKKQLQPVMAIEEESLISVAEPNNQRQQEPEHQEEQEDNYFAMEGSRTIRQAPRSKKLQEQSQQSHEGKGAKILEDDRPDSAHRHQSPEIPAFVSPANKLKKSKSNNKSLGKLLLTARNKVAKKAPAKQGLKQKPKKQEPKTKEKKKMLKHVQSEVQISHQSSTQIKVLVFKKKK